MDNVIPSLSYTWNVDITPYDSMNNVISSLSLSPGETIPVTYKSTVTCD